MSEDDGSMGKGSADAAEWRRVWLKAIAYAWRSHTFEQELIANPREVLLRQFGYTVPSGIDLKVVALEKAEAFGWNVEQKLGWSLPPTSVVVPLPPKPAHVNDHAVALFDLLGGDAGCCSDTCCF